MPSIQNFCPATGVGRFDADLSGSTVTITHRVHVNSKPDGLALSIAQKEGGSRAWELQQVLSAQKADFEQRFGPLVRQHWEGKFGFVRAGAPNQVVRPRFEIKYKSNWINTHFVVNLTTGKGGSESVGRDTYGEVPAGYGRFAPTSTSFFTGSLTPASPPALWKDLVNSFPFYVETYNGDISAHSRTQLTVLGRQVAAVDPRLPVSVTSYGTAKATARQNAISALRAAGLARVRGRMSKKPLWRTSTSPTTQRTDYVKVTIGGDWDADKPPPHLSQDFSYPATVIHEYGHMLGLQDEYNCLSQQGAQALTQFAFADLTEIAKYENWHMKNKSATPDRPAAGQFEFIKYCHEAGVEPPHFGQHTTNIMSAGSVFQPCHFVTIWAALRQIEPQTTWRIVSL